MKKAIVTGATGFIGSVFVKTLIDNKISVLALGRKRFDEINKDRAALLTGATYVQIDMKDIEALPDRARDAGWTLDESCVFYNLAWGGVARLSDMDHAAQLRNISWSVKALLAVKELNCEKFIHIGTMEEAFTHKYLSLDYHKNSEYNRHVVYSVAKIASKNFLKMFSQKAGVPLLFANNSHVMGPNDDKDSFLQVTLQKLINGDELIFSTGEQMFDVISVKDCALAYVAIGKKGLPGQSYWVGSGQARPLKEYVKIMASLYPSEQPLRFGEMPYNDISLKKEDFSIERLTKDTGFFPTQKYEDIVHELHSWLIALPQ